MYLAHLAVVEVPWKFFGGSDIQSARRRNCTHRACRKGSFGIWNIRQPVAERFLQFGTLQPPISQNVLTINIIIKINDKKQREKKQSTLRLRHGLRHLHR